MENLFKEGEFITLTDLEYGVDFLTVVAIRKYKEEIAKMLLDNSCHLIDLVYTKCSVQTGYFKDMLGLVPDEKKVMITCIVTGDKTSKILEQLITKFKFDKPNTGIAFVVPVDKLSV